MLVTLLVKFRNKDCKTTELGLLLQVLPVRIVTFVETLGSHLKFYVTQPQVVLLALINITKNIHKIQARVIAGKL